MRMTRRALAGLAVVACSAAWASTPLPPPDDHWLSEQPMVFADGGRVYYYGGMNATGADRLREVLASTHAPAELHVASPGGDVLASIDIGAQVHARGLAVVVVGRGCVSGCANYVFTPARRRTISPGSLVLWHYSCPGRLPDSRRRIAAQLRRDHGTSFQYSAGEDAPPAGTAEARDHFERNLDRLVDATLAFVQSYRAGHARIFESSGVDPRIICLVDHIPLPAVSSPLGFLYTLSTADMARLGVCNVEARPDYARWAAHTLAEDVDLQGQAAVVDLDAHPRFRPRPARPCAGLPDKS